MGKRPLLLLAAGGTGGHMFPAQALAEEMLLKGWRVTLSTDKRGARFSNNFPESVKIEISSSATFGKGSILSKFTTIFSLIRGISVVLVKMILDRPDVVVGFGGYPSVPAMTAAWILSTPRMLHEQNGVLGRVNEFFAARVAKLAYSIEPTVLPHGARGVHTGNPVRAAVINQSRSPYKIPGNYQMSLLVFGGSQGARIMSDVVPQAVSALSNNLVKNIRVSQQARCADIERVSSFYEANNIQAEVRPFFSDLPRRMAESQLIISRSGASSVADIAAIGRPAILVPLASAIRREQAANAKQLVFAGAAIQIDEENFQANTLSKVLEKFFSQPEQAAEMARKAVTCGQPEAVSKLVNQVLEITEGIPNGSSN